MTGWTEVHCKDCGKFIGMYLTDFPHQVRPWPCPCGAQTWVEPPIRQGSSM